MECIEHPIDSAKFGGRHTVQILRNGDLCTRLYLRMDLPALTADQFTKDPCGNEVYDTKAAWVRRVGHALVRNVELTIGGSQIDKHWGSWMDLWYELTHTQEQERGYNKMIGDVPELTELRSLATSSQTVPVVPAYTLYIPLQFWFCRNTGLALPLIALQYHEVRLNIELEQAANLLVQSGYTALSGVSSLSLGSCGLMVDYIYLDSEERRRFAQVGHEYLIEQLQYNGEETLVANGTTCNAKHKLEFNHPSKELVWAPKVGAWTVGQSFLTYTGNHHEDAWASALDAAATNVAEGMFMLADTAPTATATSNWTQLVLPDVAGSVSSYVTATDTPAGLSVTVLVNNASTHKISSSLSPLWVNTHALGNNGFYLGSKITDVLVTLNVDSSTGTVNWNGAVVLQTRVVATGTVTTTTFGSSKQALLPTGSVTVVGHALSLAEVSVPVADLNDGRAEVVVGGAKAVRPRDVTVLQPFNYGLQLDGQGNLVANAQLKLNGHDRFSVQDGPYFNYVQPAQHHTRTPADGVNVYSFALHPEQHQPSGSANLSRIDTTLLCVTYQDTLRTDEEPVFSSLFSNTVVNIFDFSYNVLRVMSGMAGVAYAN